MKALYHFLTGTLRGRLILGVAAVHAMMMALFIADLTARQRAMLLDRQTEEATALSQALATSAAGWIAAADIAGLQELVEAQRRYPEFLFAILADAEGRVLADTDMSRRGLYMLDLPGESRQTVFARTPALVDVVVPAMLGGRHVGWARVGIGQKAAGAKLAEITRSGVVYALAAILIGSVIAWFMGRRITRRLYVVQETIDAVRSGDRLARSSLAGDDEAAVMAREFNAMLDAQTERDAELRASEARYRSLIHRVQTAIILHDSQGRILDSNPLAQELLGLSEDQLLGKTLIDPAWHFLREDGSVLPVAEYPVSLVLSSRQPLRDYMTGISRPDRDDVAWVLVNAEPEYDDAGEIAQVIVSFVDITERKRAEQDIALMNFALNHVREAAFLIDEHARFHYVNDEACRVLGYTRAELLGLGVSEVDPDFPMERWPSHWHDLKTQHSLTFEGRHRARDGRIFPVEISANYFEYGGRAYNFALARDITARRQVEDVLRINERRYRKAQAMGYVGNWEYNLQTGHFWGSDEAKRIYGFDPEQADFSTDEVENCIPERERVHQALVDLIERDKAYDLEFEIHPRNFSEPRFIASIAQLQRDEHGEPLKVVGVIQDITERKRAGKALHRLNRELRAISTCNQILVRAEDEQILLNDICRIVCDDAGYRMAWVGFAENDDARTVRPVAWAGFEDGYLATAGITWAETERGRGPVGTAIRSGESTCVQDFAIDPPAMPWRENALQRGYRSSISLPLKDENANTFGTLNIYSTEPNAFTSDEIRLLGELADDLAFGIVVLRDRAERKRAEDELSKLNEELEERVKDRTSELEKKTLELERLTRVFVGRELRMIELKERIRELEGGE